jgi:uncharacterized membrane protein YkoI
MNYFSALVTVLFLTFNTPVWADISRDEAVVVAQKVSGGRVLAVEKAEREGRWVWRVKVLTPQGEVKVILIDAVSGQAL